MLYEDSDKTSVTTIEEIICSSFAVNTSVNVMDLGLTAGGIWAPATIKEEYKSLILSAVYPKLPLLFGYEGMPEGEEYPNEEIIAVLWRGLPQVRILTEKRNHWKKDLKHLWMLQLVDRNKSTFFPVLQHLSEYKALKQSFLKLYAVDSVGLFLVLE